MHRDLPRPLLLTLVAMVAVLLAASTAMAHHKPGHTGGPSSGVHDNRGTVEIHEGAGEPSPLMSNQPKVCTFHVHMFEFHAGQELTISIVGHGGPNAGPGSYNATATTDANGEARDPATGSITLADGMYKLTVDTGKGAGKHKVFKVDCSSTETPTGGSGDVAGATPGGAPGAGSGGGPGIVSGGSGDVAGATPGGAPGAGSGGGPGIVSGGSGDVGPGSPTKPGLLPNTAMESTDATLPMGAAIIVLAALGGLVFAVRKPAAQAI